MANNELQHWGIKGQKWGVRRYQNKNGTLTPAGKKRYANMTPDQRKKESMKQDVKNRRLLSDADLKRKIERIQNEKKLKDLTAEELEPGKKAVTEILSSSGKRALGTIVTGAMLYGVKTAMTKKFDVNDAAGYLTPKPKK